MNYKEGKIVKACSKKKRIGFHDNCTNLSFKVFKKYVITCFVESDTVKLSKALNLIEDLIIIESPTVSDVNDLKRAWKGRSSVTYSIIKNLNLNTVVEVHTKFISL